jgi:hypothetical protein
VKRLGHILLNTLTVLSVLICLATILIWARGWRTADQFAAGYCHYRPHPGIPQYQDASMLTALHWRGRWSMAIVRRACVTGPGFRKGLNAKGAHWLHTSAPADGLDLLEPRWALIKPPAGLPGFHYQNGPYFKAVVLPDWALITAAALMPAIQLVRYRRRERRTTQGLCPACGYDLRATPTRCPECGLTVAKA